MKNKLISYFVVSFFVLFFLFTTEKVKSQSVNVFKTLLSSITPGDDYLIPVMILKDGKIKREFFWNSVLYDFLIKSGIKKRRYTSYVISLNKDQFLTSYPPYGTESLDSSILNKWYREFAIIVCTKDYLTEFFGSDNNLKGKYIIGQTIIADLLWSKGIYVKSDSKTSSVIVGLINTRIATDMVIKYSRVNKIKSIH